MTMIKSKSFKDFNLNPEPFSVPPLVSYLCLSKIPSDVKKSSGGSLGPRNLDLITRLFAMPINVLSLAGIGYVLNAG